MYIKAYLMFCEAGNRQNPTRTTTTIPVKKVKEGHTPEEA